MRILKVSDVFFPRVNGVSTSIDTFRRDLTALGHEVVLVAPSYSRGSADPREPPDPSIHRVPARAVPRDPEDRIMSFGGLRQALAALTQRKFDVVHIHTPFLAHYAGLRFAREQGAPVVATYHTLFEEYLHHYVPLLSRRITGGLARRFSRSQCNQLDAVIAPSQAMQQALLLEAMAQGVPVVAIPRMGTIDILGPGLGCRHAPNDRKGFAEVVSGLLADGSALSALGAQARRYAETWASIKMAQRLAALYASLTPAARR